MKEAPAFPTPYNGRDGMTLRDYFAAKAMQADVMASAWSGDIDHTVTLAYKIADAMLEARNGTR